MTSIPKTTMQTKTSCERDMSIGATFLVVEWNVSSLALLAFQGTTVVPKCPASNTGLCDKLHYHI
jgi:hypothetical protein